MDNISLSIVHTRTGVKLLRLFHDQGLPEPNLQGICESRFALFLYLRVHLFPTYKARTINHLNNKI